MATLYLPTPLASARFTSTDDADGSVKASFDAFLYKPAARGEQLKLTINLRFALVPLPAKPLFGQRDANDRPFWTLPWNPVDWGRFVAGASAQAELWNNKFWLLPPATFSEYDTIFTAFVKHGFRPNIRCELVVDFAAKSDAHRTIEVANLDVNLLPGATRGPGTFRSHALLYDSLDTVPWAFPLGNAPGQPARHYVIAHEIGHALGLGHIGVLRKTPLCDFAMRSEHVLGGAFAGPQAKGGTNSFYCYGAGQGIGVSDNIMGAGDKFTVENARPWIWAIGLMRQRPAEASQWRVVMSDPGPGSGQPREAPWLLES